METLRHKKALRGLFSKTEDTQNASISLENQNSGYTVTKIQYNFDRLREEREHWRETDYVVFFNRITNAQTEAFFLKGKLVAEIKARFYEDNKTGWKVFCENNLNMNYTTANQYIRVAREFDVMSHHYKDFDFEHFKALLPLPPEKRELVLQRSQGSMSVKSLRSLVADALVDGKRKINQTGAQSTRIVLATLKKLETEFQGLVEKGLTESEKIRILESLRSFTNVLNAVKTVKEKE